MQYIELNKELIPYTFSIVLNKEIFDFRVDYNNTASLFTMSLWKDGKLLCNGEPIIYGKELFGDIKTRGNFPKVRIIPIDESGENDSVTFDNLSETVFLSVGEYE